ncbi:transport permease protein [Paenibacillus tyrfis]|uniref:ABC transporter permease n=1 Tax=Paenibacillus tyrfis TaxID=1501230 RepID=UPI00248FE0FE|nr:ABC transporter permease [Paenibacillus tyrfis]GLI09877.1 transport permease protein [Paenibacillus tyrfis]
MSKNFKSHLSLIYDLSKKDFQNKYLGSYLGVIWAFVHPSILILIFWFVFQVGFKSMPVDNFPFVLWLIAGIIPWFFFSDAFPNATNSVVESSYLVKKVVFKIELLPLVKLTTSLKIHLFFIFVTFLMFQIYGYGLSIYNFQIIYYLLAMIILTVGLSYLTSALLVFLKDTSQIVAMMMQFGFWITPIFWSLKTVPDNFVFIFKLNPLFYIVNGYRESFIYHTWFWEHPWQTLYFWTGALLFLFLGRLIFKKLKPHFSDVL